jgi:hypothetical protein
MIRLNALQPIVEPDGTMTQHFRTWALAVSNNLPIVGTGTPEGVIEAPQYSLYIDETVPLTPVQYRKMLPEIGGDRTTGWAAL